MADNYVQFSEYLPFSTDEKQALEEQTWAKIVLEMSTEECEETQSRLLGLGVKIEPMQLDCWPGFDYSVDANGVSIWSDEHGDIDSVVSFVQAFLRKFSPKGRWAMGWAETCSKPRAGQFGGGAILILPEAVIVKTTWEWLDEIASTED